MRTFVQYAPDGTVTAIVQEKTAPIHPRQIDATERTDGPWKFKIYDPATDTFAAIPAGPNAVIPPVTKAQAAAILKALLEDPPTGADPWTQLQRDQCMYALLLGLFKDLKNGTVY